jgi:hypothetical protein
MGEETTEAAVAEQPQEVVQQESQAQEAQTQEEKQVPLKALQAERRKRQEAEYQAKWMQEQLQSAQSNPKANNAEDDGDELLTKSDFTKMSQSQLVEFKRQTLEESFISQHPDAMDTIETELPEILKKKPWLAHAINNSPNRYQTAYEVIKDYRPKTENVRQRIAENAEKPGSPAGVGKGGSISKDYSKMSNSEFREYRQSLRNKR